MNPSSPLTRRQFVSCVSLIAAATPALGALPAVPVCNSALREPSRALDAPSKTPVVSFHVNQPYLDKSGNATPYRPPAGARSGQAVSELSEVEFLCRYVYV